MHGLDLENVMLSELSETQKNKTAGTWKMQITHTESTTSVTRGWGEGRKGCYCVVGVPLLLGMMERLWRWEMVMMVMTAHHCECP